MSDGFERGRRAAVTWGGDTDGARQTAQRILGHLRHEVTTADEAAGFAAGLRDVADEVERIGREARRQGGDGEPARPIPGDRVAQHRHIHGPGHQVTWRETVGEVLAVAVEPGAIGGWVALVLWPELRGSERYGVLDSMDFSDRAGQERARIVAEGTDA